MTEPRPPVIGIFGHIDHGKSTLLDHIRKTNTTEREAGGITQHISAYEVSHKSKEGKESRITFIDTPGHEAFKSVRSRGASAADIAILIVSAEEGVKPQTLEALSQIQASNIPYIATATKIDRPSANLEKVKQDLAEKGVFVEGYGGDIPFAAVSAKTGEGVDDLLDTLVLLAEIEGFTGKKEAPGSGVIIESKLDPKSGITATAIIKNGTVKKGHFAAAGNALAPLRFLLNTEGENVEEISFSSPVQITGWDRMPEVGAVFKTFEEKDAALSYIQEYADTSAATGPEATLETAEGVDTLSLVIKADTAGSVEAIKYELSKISRERIAPRIILEGVGKINEGDVKVATSAPGSVILGFNTKADTRAKALAERAEIPLETFSIIYELTNKVKTLLEEREPRVEVEEITGRAKILKVFSVTKDKQVVGGRVLTGTINRGASVRIIRREAEIGKGVIKELQQAKADISSVIEETEFGTLVESKTEIAPNDILEAVTTVTK